MNHEEFKIHAACVEHHATAFPHVTLMYVPNAVRDKSDAYWNKVLGAQPGAHDLFHFWGEGDIEVGIFEVKSRSGKLSTNQNKFAGRMFRHGAKTGFGSSVRAYHETVKSWGVIPRHEAIKEPDLRTDEEKKADSFDFYRAL